MKIKTPVSLSTIDTKTFNVLDKGPYPVRVTNYTEGVSKAGNTKVDLEMEITDGPGRGRKLFGTITPGSVAALPFVRIALEAFGVSWDDEGFDPVGFIGRTAVANVDVDLYDPTNPRNTVRSFRRAA